MGLMRIVKKGKGHEVRSVQVDKQRKPEELATRQLEEKRLAREGVYAGLHPDPVKAKAAKGKPTQDNTKKKESGDGEEEE